MSEGVELQLEDRVLKDATGRKGREDFKFYRSSEGPKVQCDKRRLQQASLVRLKSLH